MSNQNSTPHDKAVESVVKFYRDRNYQKIKAHLPGYDTPDEIDGYIPDITADHSDGNIVAEIETSDSLGTEHSRKQCEAFAKSPRGFCLWVPKSEEQQARNIVRQWGIENDTSIGVY